ncbi:hypothetical protein L0Y87_04560 [Burkholderia multivorans]|uniref:hypothetical protein n=1 Tax=Burkholderia multivorans TaxID=87883 RepID=UPI00207CE73B|nr:hypothetical protein [Burkholderia multivorans]MCO1381552.1 hypothetical protein [Burkholderia multivorans]
MTRLVLPAFSLPGFWQKPISSYARTVLLTGVSRSALFIPWTDLVRQSIYFAVVKPGSRMKNLIASLCAALALAGCSDSHLQIKLTHNPSFPNIPRLRLTAVGQDVTVNGVEINDGDCSLNRLEGFPRTIPQGQSDTVDILSSCDNVEKATIITDGGTFKFSFH